MKQDVNCGLQYYSHPLCTPAHCSPYETFVPITNLYLFLLGTVPKMNLMKFPEHMVSKLTGLALALFIHKHHYS